MKTTDTILLTKKMNHCTDTAVPPRFFDNWSIHVSMVYPDYPPKPQLSHILLQNLTDVKKSTE